MVRDELNEAAREKRRRRRRKKKKKNGAAVWRLKKRRMGYTWDKSRGWPRIRMPGELLKVAYAAASAKGNGGDHDDGRLTVSREHFLSCAFFLFNFYFILFD